MAKQDKKVARQRFDEIMGVAKRHHLAKLLKDNEDDEDFEISDLRYGSQFLLLADSELSCKENLKMQYIQKTKWQI